MAMSGLMLLLVFLQTVTSGISGTIVFSCKKCNGHANCLKEIFRPKNGGTFVGEAFSCVCKEGFVGNGFKCYNKELCKNHTCCRQGYQFLPERGCVDTNECLAPKSPCAPPLVCKNTPGSYQCKQPPPKVRSRRDVQFQCGNSLCPLGKDCINVKGTAQCVDPCDYYNILDDAWRSTNYSSNDVGLHCDSSVNWQGWYRLFQGSTSAQVPEKCVKINMCGTHAPMWITTPHPTLSDGIVQRSVCGSWSNGCCTFSSNPIHVKQCYGDYYVYKLVQPNYCHLAYCAEVNRTAISVQPSLSQIDCSRSHLRVGLNLARLQLSGFNAFSGHLADPRCSRFTQQDGIVWYQVNRQAGICGNTLTVMVVDYRTNRTHAVYSNSLFVFPVSNVSLVVPLNLPFSCVYPLDTEDSLNVNINSFLSLVGGISAVGAPPKASMSLFRNSNYTEPYPSGRVTLPVGSDLYVGVSVDETDPGFVLLLANCYTTLTPNKSDLARYLLIQNKCPSDLQHVKVVENGMSLRARFSAQVFLFHREYRDMYLHCSLVLCDRRNDPCTVDCSRRVSRSVSTTEPIIPLTAGPISWDKSQV